MMRLVAAILLLLLASPAYGIFEDQVGEFDWKMENIGRVERASFGPKGGAMKALYVASDERSRAFARLDVDSGDIVWRQVLMQDDAIEDMHVTEDGVLIASGGRNVRMWDAQDGTLLWDNSIVQSTLKSSFIGILPTASKQAVVVSTSSAALMDLTTGDKVWETSFEKDLTAHGYAHLSSDSSSLFVVLQADDRGSGLRIGLADGRIQDLSLSSSSNIVGLRKTEGEQAFIVSVSVSESSVTIESFDTSSTQTTKLSALGVSDDTIQSLEPSAESFIVLKLSSGQRVVCKLESSLSLSPITVLSADGAVSEVTGDSSFITHTTIVEEKNALSTTFYATSDSTLSKSSETDVGLPSDMTDASSSFVSCDNDLHCVHLLVMQDDTLVFMDESHKWTREEALGNVKQVHWITPIESDAEKQGLTNLPTFTQELELEVARLQTLYEHIVAYFSTPAVKETKRQESRNAHLFGFSKLALALTDSGKLFAIRVEANAIAWSKFVGPDAQLHVMRDHPAVGTGAELLLTYADGKMVRLDGDDGKVVEEIVGTGKYAVVMPKHRQHADEDVVSKRGVALVASDLSVQLYPSEALASDVHDFFFYRFDSIANAFHGFRMQRLHEELQVHETWSIVLPKDARVVANARPKEAAAVDSSVTITGDGSLLVKYLNPHMFGVSTLTSDGDSNTLEVILIDAVSGRVVHRARHTQASEPVEMAQSENWVVYTYWNDREKRTELVSLSLFDGAVGSHGLNPWKRPIWSDTRSSFDPKAPFVLQKNYVFPSQVSTLGVTTTARGITPEFLLVGLANGQVFKLSKGLIDPRQPERAPTPEEQTEGLMQYHALLPLHSHAIHMITYNQSIANLDKITTAPAELESTTLVFAYGLDLFYMRVAPAKAFDLLPSDFNYEMLIVLCLTFVAATLLTRALAQRKALHEAWK